MLHAPGWAVVAALSAIAVEAPQVGAQSAPAPLTFTRDLRIDATEQDLSPIGWLLVARNGTIVAAQPQDNLLRYFDGKGTPLGTFGRGGAGPGEFKSLGLRGWAGDTLWVGDISTRRLTLVGPDRKLATTVPFPTAVTVGPSAKAPLPSLAFIIPQSYQRDGSMLVSALAGKGADWTEWTGADNKDATPILRVSGEGVLDRIVAWRPSFHCSVSIEIKGGTGSMSIPFCATPLLAYSDDGGGVAQVSMENATGRGAHYQLTVVRDKGDTVFSRTYAYAPQAIPRQAADSAIAARLPDARRRVDRGGEEDDDPAHVPTREPGPDWSRRHRLAGVVSNGRDALLDGARRRRESRRHGDGAEERGAAGREPRCGVGHRD